VPKNTTKRHYIFYIIHMHSVASSLKYGEIFIDVLIADSLIDGIWLMNMHNINSDWMSWTVIESTHTHTHTLLTALFLGLHRWAGTRKVKPSWILLKQETVSGSGISWAICKSAPCCRQTTTPAPHHSVFYRPDALHATQPTVSKHWRQCHWKYK